MVNQQHLSFPDESAAAAIWAEIVFHVACKNVTNVLQYHKLGLFLIYDIVKHARSGLVRFIGPCECDTNDLISLLSTIGNIRFKAKELWRWMNPF